MVDSEERKAGDGWSHAFVLEYDDGRTSFHPNHGTIELAQVKSIISPNLPSHGGQVSLSCMGSFTRENWMSMGDDISKCQCLHGAR